MIKKNLNLLIVLLLISLAAAKRCGKNYGKCPDGYCCSKFGFCGKIDTYCGKGCQSDFGECYGTKKTVTIQKVSTKVKSAKETNEQNLAESVVNVVDALINEEADQDSKNEIVEEVIDALAAEVDTANDSDPENDDGNDEAEVVQNNDENNEAQEAENISEEEGEENGEEEGEEVGEEVNENNDDNEVSEDEITEVITLTDIVTDTITEEETILITDTIDDEPNTTNVPEKPTPAPTGDEEESGGTSEETTPKKDNNEEEEEESGGTSEETTPKKDNNEEEEEESGGTSEETTPKKDNNEEEEENDGTSEETTPKKDNNEEEEENDGTSEETTPKKDNNEEESSGNISEDETESGNTSEEPTVKEDNDEEKPDTTPGTTPSSTPGSASEEPTTTPKKDEEESGGNSEEPTTNKDNDEEKPSSTPSSTPGSASEEPTTTPKKDEEESGGASEEPTTNKDEEKESTTTTEKPAPTTTTTEKQDSTTTTEKPAPTTTVPAPSGGGDGECSTQAFGMAQPFNGFFFGDFTGTSSDVQGRLAAKGTVNISGGYQNGGFIYDPVKHNEQTNLDCTNEKMKGDIKYAIVAGTLNFRDGGEILNGGVAYQNSADMPGYIKEAIERHKCSVEKKTVINFDKEKQNLTSLSKKIGGMAANTKTTNEWGKLVIDLVPGQKTYVIAEDITKYWGISVNENGVNIDEITIIFNLLSENITLTNFDISSINKYATRIVWNAPNAKKIRIENFRIQGSLLAPNADIEGYNSNIQGQMIGNSFKGSLQIDWVPFYGCL